MSEEKKEEGEKNTAAADPLKFMSSHEREMFYKQRRESKSLARAINAGPQSSRRIGQLMKKYNKRDKLTGGV